ncbi:hypothetical protein [Cyclobacterium sediminis]
MRLIFVISLLYCFLACTTQKAITRSQDHQLTTSQHHQIQSHEQANQTTGSFDQERIRLDYSQTFIDIVPRGTFRVSPDGSFEGEASNIRIHHRDSSRQEDQTKVDLTSSDSSASFAQLDSAASDESSSDDQEREVSRKPDFWLYIGIAVAALIIIAGLRFFPKFKLF